MLAAPSYGSLFAMSYPYQPYQQSYSEHSTPPSFWDVDQQQQQPQPQDPLQVSVIDHQPSISPQVFQQQLSPMTPMEAALSLDQQPQQPQATYDLPQTIQIQERVQRSQFRFDNIDESHFLQQPESTETRRRSSRPRVSGASDEVRPSTASPGSGGAIGPSRASHGKAQAPHPYRRPSTTGSAVGGASRNAGGVRSSTRIQQRENDVLGERSSRLPHVFSPTVGSSMTTACPAMHMWRVATVPSVVESGDRPTRKRPSAVKDQDQTSAAEPAATDNCSEKPAMSPTPTGEASTEDVKPSVGTVLPAGPPVQIHPQIARRLIIRADVHYDPAAQEMTAVFELPGLKKHDMSIRMHVCPFSGVRQLTVMGRSRPLLPEGMYTVQERKFGDFYRTVVVPLNTKPQDIVATMEDGILILKVPCGTPSEEEPQEVQEIKIQ